MCVNSLSPPRNPVKSMLLFFHFKNDENKTQNGYIGSSKVHGHLAIELELELSCF